ncbi:hypothetical protein [Allorhizocola rhizosphaerae]|uniref:hypothetical protein n=1 Tax=Allorhizocola rhizosphaerae TaxID=1872709 RepID=UPI0013C3366B|nr:hypothetical protein [Allorhizocola rhizosphaerae]
MVIKTLDELRQADDRTLRFTPLGLGLSVQMRPDAAADCQQQVVAEFELAPDVGDGARQSFEHLRTVYAYGVLCYEVYTLVGDHALLVIEQALRERFVDFHCGTVTFVDRNGVEHPVAVTRFEQVQEFLRGRQPGRRMGSNGGWRLRLPDGRLMGFDGGMLGDLRAWTRKADLLRGQRNRGIEQALSNLRNFVAPPTGYHLNGQVEAARTRRDLAENHQPAVGGHDTGWTAVPGAPAPRCRRDGLADWRRRVVHRIGLRRLRRVHRPRRPSLGMHHPACRFPAGRATQ